MGLICISLIINDVEPLFFLFFDIVVELQLSCHFPPLLSPMLFPSLPQSIPPPPLSVPMSPLFMFLCLPLPLLSPVISLPVSSGHCQFLLYF